MPDWMAIVSSLRSWYWRLSEWPAVTWIALPQNLPSTRAKISSWPHGLSTRRTAVTHSSLLIARHCARCHVHSRRSTIGGEPGGGLRRSERPHSCTDSSSARASGRMPAAANASGVTSPGQRAAQHLAALAEAGPHQREQPVGVGRRWPARSRRRDARPAPTRPAAAAGTRRGRPGRPPWPTPSRRPSPTGCRRRRCPARRPAARPTSRCTITSIRVDRPARRRAGRARAAWRRCRGGWPRATHVGVAARAPRPSRAPSRRRPPRARRSRSTTSRSAGSRWRSISTAVTSAPVSASARVSDPSPAPISTTASPGPTPARRAMRRTVFGSTTKFWPRARLGARPCRSSSSVTWRRVRSRRRASLAAGTARVGVVP